MRAWSNSSGISVADSDSTHFLWSIGSQCRNLQAPLKLGSYLEPEETDGAWWSSNLNPESVHVG